MGTTINTNVSSLTAQRNLSASQSSLSTSMQRLSSGLRVNSAKDDAAGLAIAERMNSQIKGMNVAIRNAGDAISLSQTAESALGKVSDSLQRMRELAVQSSNATNSAGDRTNLNTEYQALNSEVTRVLSGTKFNGTAVLGAAATLAFQVGANNIATDSISLTTTNLANGTGASAVTAGGITTAAASLTAMDDIDTAITEISTARATFGAAQNRFEAVISNLQVGAENQAASRGRIVDADFAAETANLSRTQVLQQAGMAMVAQANALPNGVMQLLRG
ncbi:MAG: flagellin FliC [Aeromicrobium sp.]|nr:flagellin FliC [Burkholderiales bacterium]